jgi:hypothetical protein
MAVFRCQRSLGDTVYPKHASERTPLIVTAVTFSPAGGYVYACSWPTGESASFFECELVTEWTGYLPEPSQDEPDADA